MAYFYLISNRPKINTLWFSKEVQPKSNKRNGIAKTNKTISLLIVIKYLITLNNTTVGTNLLFLSSNSIKKCIGPSNKYYFHCFLMKKCHFWWCSKRQSTICYTTMRQPQAFCSLYCRFYICVRQKHKLNLAKAKAEGHQS